MTHNSFSQKILCVDDEPRLLSAIKRQLRKEFDISVAEGADEGLELLASEGPFAAVISDYNMPETNGIAFLNQLHSRYPETVLSMLTGQAELDVAVTALHEGHISRFLNKPCPREILSQSIRDSLEQYRLIMAEKQLRIELEQANNRLNTLNQNLEEIVAARTDALATQFHYVRRLAEFESVAQISGAFTNAVRSLAKTDQIVLFLKHDYDDDLFIAQSSVETPRINLDLLETGTLKTCLQNRDISRLEAELLTVPEQKIFSGNPLACVSLESEKCILGILTVSGNQHLDNTVLASIKTLADTTATTLMNLRHSEARSDAQDAIIVALAKLSESKDPETGAHLNRLKRYCRLICNILSANDKYKHIVTQRFTDDLVKSSPLHDIGKVGIPDAVLKKPGKLSEEEFEVMKTHAAIGGDTLRSVFDHYRSQTFIKSGMEVAYCHHEKWAKGPVRD